MHKLMILSTVALLASTSGVLAEDNADLLQPVDHGIVTGETEGDSVACNIRVPADPWVGLNDACIVSDAAPIQPAPVSTTAARINPHETTPIRRASVSVTGPRANPHETAPIRRASVSVTGPRANPHETTPIRPAPMTEASLPN